ncbi:hypothetical protein H9645_06210 [Luteimonas sp. Sa2BVA3]|uniref:DNA-binding protein n=1 Tax=Luteimonas colneyensis TaxID=2762230 RepID=A0ABR8UHZ9_9GAMM|nr:hypothetical protein [Luteimonas colneyensis]MBD7987621.1 hypothetical protein [Luteimonas colneyensis]
MQTAQTDIPALERNLVRHYGPYVPVAVAWRWLSFSSLEAARCAWRRGKTPVPFMRLRHRRGLFIKTHVLAQWLQAQGLTCMQFLAPHPGKEVAP